MKTLEQLKSIAWAGNHFHDHENFDATHEFVMAEQNTTADRAEALRNMNDRGMGMGREEGMSDAEIVEEYVSMM